MDVLFHSVDKIVLAAAGINFVIFLLVHILVLRFGQFRSTFRVISYSFLLGITGCALGFIWFGQAKLDHHDAASIAALLLSGFLCIMLYGLLVFHYIAWVFGMGEAAIRIRLLHEIDCAGEKGISLDEIYQRYNAQKILDSRLARLVNSGHLRFDGKFYRVASRILLLQTAISRLLRWLLGITPRTSVTTERSSLKSFRP